MVLKIYFASPCGLSELCDGYFNLQKEAINLIYFDSRRNGFDIFADGSKNFYRKNKMYFRKENI